MSEITTCKLVAVGDMPQAWVGRLLALFRAYSANIRKFTLLGGAEAGWFSRLELQYSYPASAARGHTDIPLFVDRLAIRLQEIRWHTLRLDPPLANLPESIVSDPACYPVVGNPEPEARGVFSAKGNR